MKKFTSILILLALLKVPGVFAQQDPQLSNYMFNVLEFNPAYAGSENMVSGVLQARTQWDGITGHPFTGLLGVHTPIPTINSGLGIEVTDDQEGQLNTFTGHINYAYLIKFSRKSVLSLGVQGGVMQASLDGANLRSPQGVYTGGTINHNDPLIPVGFATSTAPDAGAGAYFHTDKLGLGFSVQHILPSNFLFSGPAGNSEISAMPTYYGYGSYYIKLSGTLTLRPCFLIKADDTHQQGDIDMMLLYKDVFYIGAGYRGISTTDEDAGIVLLGIKLTDNWFLGYSYDLTISGLASYESGTHELFLKYTYALIRPPKPGKSIYTPRY